MKSAITVIGMTVKISLLIDTIILTQCFRDCKESVEIIYTEKRQKTDDNLDIFCYTNFPKCTKNDSKEMYKYTLLEVIPPKAQKGAGVHHKRSISLAWATNSGVFASFAETLTLFACARMSSSSGVLRSRTAAITR